MTSRAYSLVLMLFFVLASPGCDDSTSHSSADAQELTDNAPEELTDQGNDDSSLDQSHETELELEDVAVDTDSQAADLDTVPDNAEDLVAPMATTALFDLVGAQAGAQYFYDFPFPSDLRTHANGAPDMTGFPAPPLALVTNALTYIEAERAGFSPQGGVYFRFDGAVDLSNYEDPLVSADAPMQLINIDPDSPEYGQRVPVLASFHTGRSAYWSRNTLCLRIIPGLGMLPGTRYAAILTQDLRTPEGLEVLPAAAFTALIDSDAEDATTSSYRPVFNTLRELGIAPEDLVSATFFRTSDVSLEMDALRDYLQANEVGAVANWAVDSPGPVNQVYTGRFESVEFFSGEAPYDEFGSSSFQFDASGAPQNAQPVSIRFSITLPNGTPPAGGFPIVLYGHGTGGDYKTHAWSSGAGSWLANEGIATIGFDAALHGDRLEEAPAFEALLMTNPLAAREMVRQSVVDQMVVLRLLRQGAFDIPGNVTGGAPIQLRRDQLYMGHSQGSQHAGLLIGVEPELEAAFLSAGGGGTVLGILEREFEGESVACLIGLVIGVTCSNFQADHPALNLVIQPLMDAADPLNYAHRFLRYPSPEDKATHIYMSEGAHDQETPPPTQEALAAAIGLPVVAPQVRSSMPLEFAGNPTVEAPSQGNLNTEQGAVTGGLIQWATGDHFAVFDIPLARRQYLHFFTSYVADGVPELLGFE